jgi:predicted transposase YbfD/YdcC
MEQTKIDLEKGRILSDTICCPRCGKEQNGFMCPDKEVKPTDGTLSLCIYCLSIGKYADGVSRIVALTHEDMVKLEEESPGIMIQVAEQISAIIRLKKIKGISDLL